MYNKMLKDMHLGNALQLRLKYVTTSPLVKARSPACVAVIR